MSYIKLILNTNTSIKLSETDYMYTIFVTFQSKYFAHRLLNGKSKFDLGLSSTICVWWTGVRPLFLAHRIASWQSSGSTSCIAAIRYYTYRVISE